MKARDLIKLLRDNPDLEVVVDNGVTEYTNDVTCVEVRDTKVYNPGTETHDIPAKAIVVTISIDTNHTI